MSHRRSEIPVHQKSNEEPPSPSASNKVKQKSSRMSKLFHYFSKERNGKNPKKKEKKESSQEETPKLKESSQEETPKLKRCVSLRSTFVKRKNKKEDVKVKEVDKTRKDLPNEQKQPSSFKRSYSFMWPLRGKRSKEKKKERAVSQQSAEDEAGEKIQTGKSRPTPYPQRTKGFSSTKEDQTQDDTGLKDDKPDTIKEEEEERNRTAAKDDYIYQTVTVADSLTSEPTSEVKEVTMTMTEKSIGAIPDGSLPVDGLPATEEGVLAEADKSYHERREETKPERPKPLSSYEARRAFFKDIENSCNEQKPSATEELPPVGCDVEEPKMASPTTKPDKSDLQQDCRGSDANPERPLPKDLQEIMNSLLDFVWDRRNINSEDDHIPPQSNIPERPPRRRKENVSLNKPPWSVSTAQQEPSWRGVPKKIPPKPPRKTVASEKWSILQKQMAAGRCKPIEDKQCSSDFDKCAHPPVPTESSPAVPPRRTYRAASPSTIPSTSARDHLKSYKSRAPLPPQNPSTLSEVTTIQGTATIV